MDILPSFAILILTMHFRQLYLESNETFNKDLFARTEKAGAKAIIFTVDSAADGNRHRAARFGVGSA